jgi:hypothetical protein
MAHRGGRGDRGRLALVEASLTALSGAAAGARTPLPGAAPNGLGPWRRPTPAGILMFQKLTSRECSPKKGGVGTSSSDAKLGGINL